MVDGYCGQLTVKMPCDFTDKYRNSYGRLNITKAREIQPGYLAMPNFMYGNWEIGMYNPRVFNKKSAFDMTPQERHQQRKDSLNRLLPN